MTEISNIHEAEKLGVDFIGLIFVPSSPRSISFESAKSLRKEIVKAKAVGVFMDMPSEEVNKYCSELKLDFAQLHGVPNLDLCKEINIPTIQAFRGVPNVETTEEFLEICQYILIDKADNEDEANFSKIAALPNLIRSKLFLAGGLNSENIQKAVDMVNPFAVDCARGIEIEPRKKDTTKMLSFINNLPST
ncbi:MAG: phosphoribosylanthranilate isomerase [Candidatus Peribacteraceae bacterium]|nr:phosphoribosylanthranilate isomerase [Candidatus Peribacteraceae bacterium]